MSGVICSSIADLKIKLWGWHLGNISRALVWVISSEIVGQLTRTCLITQG